MTRRIRSAILLLACCSLGAGCRGGDAQPSSVGSVAQPSSVIGVATSFSSPGPFATTSTDVSNCTIFRPTTLGQGGVTHPVILWGNGTNASPASYSGFLSHLASHGFIVAAANTPNAGDGSQMLDCLTFVEGQNATSGSPFFQHVDIRRVGASGHSQGGAGAIMAGRDGRVAVTAPLQPYIFPISGGGTFLTSSIGQQHGPMFLVSGGADTTAVPSTHQLPVFNGGNASVVWGTLAGASHYEPLGDAGNFRGAVTAWFRAQLMDDAAAAQMFPPACALCATAGWTVVSK